LRLDRTETEEGRDYSRYCRTEAVECRDYIRQRLERAEAEKRRAGKRQRDTKGR
jgi:hypothetical protein